MNLGANNVNHTTYVWSPALRVGSHLFRRVLFNVDICQMLQKALENIFLLICCGSDIIGDIIGDMRDDIFHHLFYPEVLLPTHPVSLYLVKHALTRKT